MKKVLLTGGLGYIGTHFFETYQDQYLLKILDTNFFNNKLIESENIIFKDIREVEKKDIEGFECVVHMAELSNDPLGDLNKEMTEKINHLGTKKLMEIANNTSVNKFIYMSSASVYGFSESIMKEDSPINPLTEYSKAKAKNEKFILDNDFSFETIILRNSTAFGFSNNLRLDLVVNDLTFDGYFNKKINLLSDGTPKRPLVHIYDICNFIDILINESRDLNKEIFNVGSDNLNFSIKQVAETVGKVLNLEDISFGLHDSDQRSYELSFKKIYEFFPSLKIKYNLEEGIKNLVDNFEKYELTGNEKRIKVLQELLSFKKLNNELYWADTK